SGEHEVNQLFFDQVRVAVSLRVGTENAGWTIAKSLLEFERGGGSATARTERVIAELRRVAALEPDGCRGVVGDDRILQVRLAAIEIETEALKHTQLSILRRVSAGEPVGEAAASLLKLKASELLQRATELAMDVIGPYALADQHTLLGERTTIGPAYAATATACYLNTRARSIFGGSSEIQRAILA